MQTKIPPAGCRKEPLSAVWAKTALDHIIAERGLEGKGVLVGADMASPNMMPVQFISTGSQKNKQRSLGLVFGFIDFPGEG